MPTEVRRITFRPSELAEALGAQSKSPEFDIDQAALAFVRGSQGEQLLEIADAKSSEGSVRTLRLDAEEIGAALVRYCLDSGIPIPKDAGRSLSLTGGRLSLFIHMEETAEESNISLPDFYHYDFYG